MGSRTPDFLKDIKRRVFETGGRYQQIPERFAPTTIVLNKLTKASFAEIECMGIHVSCAFAAKLSSLLPSPNRASCLIHEAQLPYSINRFNFETLEFNPDNRSLHNNGLYEIPQFGRDVYVLKSGADQRIVPRDWGEWMFLSACGRKKGLTFYERKSQTWCVNSKLHLPLTLDQCATLCSGSPPEMRVRDSLFCYADVPVGIAYRLTKALRQDWEVV